MGALEDCDRLAVVNELLRFACFFLLLPSRRPSRPIAVRCRTAQKSLEPTSCAACGPMCGLWLIGIDHLRCSAPSFHAENGGRSGVDQGKRRRAPRASASSAVVKCSRVCLRCLRNGLCVTVRVCKDPPTTAHMGGCGVRGAGAAPQDRRRRSQVLSCCPWRCRLPGRPAGGRNAARALNMLLMT